MPLINLEVNIILTWSAKCTITSSSDAGIFARNYTKLHVPVVTLSIQDSEELLQQSNQGFKRTIKWNKYKPKVSTQTQNQYLDELI